MSAGERLELAVLLRRLGASTSDADTEQILGRCEGATLAASLYLAEVLDAQVTALSVGPANRENRVLAMALRAGCHRAVRIDAPGTDQMDYLSVAQVLARAVDRDRDDFDLVLCGDRAQDELLGAVGPAVAELLGIAHLRRVTGVRVEEGLVVARQRGDDCFHTYRCGFPSLLCISEFEPPPKSAVQQMLEELGELPDDEADDDGKTGRTVTRRGGALEELRADQLELDARALRRRRRLTGTAHAAHRGAHATMAQTSAELIRLLQDDRLI